MLTDDPSSNFEKKVTNFILAFGLLFISQKREVRLRIVSQLSLTTKKVFWKFFRAARFEKKAFFFQLWTKIITYNL